MMVTAKRARLTGLMVVAVMFAVGALTGAATMRVAATDRTEVKETERKREPRPSLWETLELTPVQREQVDAIMERRRGEVESFWNEHGPQLRAVMDSARADVRELLTPEQRELEEKFFAERRKHYQRHDR
jgi:Spy/CpxP family protein refolding chaperone